MYFAILLALSIYMYVFEKFMFLSTIKIVVGNNWYLSFWYLISGISKNILVPPNSGKWQSVLTSAQKVVNPDIYSFVHILSKKAENKKVYSKNYFYTWCECKLGNFCFTRAQSYHHQKSKNLNFI